MRAWRCLVAVVAAGATTAADGDDAPVVPPIAYLKLHKVGSESVARWLGAFNSHRGANARRCAWKREPELPAPQRSATWTAEDARSAPNATTTRYFACSGRDSATHATLRVYKFGGLAGLASCFACPPATAPARVVVVASLREPTSRFISSLFYYVGGRARTEAEAAVRGDAPWDVALVQRMSAHVFGTAKDRGYPKPADEYLYYFGGPSTRLTADGAIEPADREAGLRRALDALETHVDVVGLTERLDAFVFFVARETSLVWRGVGALPCVPEQNSAGDAGVRRTPPDDVARSRGSPDLVRRRRELRGIAWHGLPRSPEVAAYLEDKLANDTLIYRRAQALVGRALDALSPDDRADLAAFEARCERQRKSGAR